MEVPNHDHDRELVLADSDRDGDLVRGSDLPLQLSDLGDLLLDRGG